MLLYTMPTSNPPAPGQQPLASYLAISLQSTTLQHHEIPWIQNPMIVAIVLFSRNVHSLQGLITLIQQVKHHRPDMIFMIDHEGLEPSKCTNNVRYGVWRTFEPNSQTPLTDLPTADTQFTIGNIPCQESAKKAAYASGVSIAKPLAQLGIIPLATVLDSNDHHLPPAPRPTTTTHSWLQHVFKNMLRALGIHQTNTHARQTVSDATPGAVSPTASTASALQASSLGWVIYGLARSFGPTHRIAELAREKLQGIRSQDCPTVVKHFPDHGNARDTHDMHTVCDTRSMQEVDHFLHAVYQPLVGMIDIIMTNHIQYPSSPDANTEAGLSAYWLQRARTYLGETGLIISDCLGMGAMQAKGLDLANAISIASMPDANTPNAMTDIVLVCNQPSYTALLQTLSHQPNSACTQRVHALKRWARSKSPRMQCSPSATVYQ